MSSPVETPSGPLAPPLVNLLYAMIVHDETAGAPEAWSRSLGKVDQKIIAASAWPVSASFADKSKATHEEIMRHLLVEASKLGAAGRSITRMTLATSVARFGLSEVATLQILCDPVEVQHKHFGRAPKRTEQWLHECTVEVGQYAFRRLAESAQYHIKQGDSTWPALVETLNTYATLLPSANTWVLPVPEGPAYIAGFTRTEADYLISLGFTEADARVGGLKPGDTAAVCGRTSVGKSAAMMAIARAQIFPKANVNWRQHKQCMEERMEVRQTDGVDVLYISLEMSAQDLRERLMCDLLDVNASTWRKDHDQALRDSMVASSLGANDGALDSYLMRLAHSASTLTIVDVESLKGQITAASLAGALGVWAEAMRAKNPNARLLACLDYFQKIGVSPSKNATRQQALAEVSAAVFATAKRERVATVIGAQIGRAADDHQPTAAEIRESGDLAQDADFVFVLHALSPQRRKIVEAVHKEVIDFDANEPAAKKPSLKKKVEENAAKSGMPSMCELACDCVYLIAEKARGAENGWIAPLHFNRDRVRLTDGWSSKPGTWIEPLNHPEVVKALADAAPKTRSRQGSTTEGESL